tara:strand:- start:303 stop:1412 length:1110 start_codon:yes stop_codon:yes gene_type:complete
MKGYGKKEPGQYSYGAGLRLHVGKKGASSWHFRIRSNGKDTTTIIGAADSQQNERWARRQIELMKSGQQVSSSTLGPAIMDWASSKLKTKRWSDRHHEKTTERIKKHCGKLLEVKIAEITRPMIVSHLETIDDIDSAGRVYSWIKECLEVQVDRGALDYCVLGRKPETLTLPKSAKNRQKSFEADYAKVAELLRAIKLSDATRSVRLAGQLAILSGLRLGEIVQLRTEFVLEDRVIIPRELMKVKDHWRKDYQLPIPGELKVIIDAAVESAEQGWLFFNTKMGKPITLESVEKQFRELSQRQHVPHGSRTSLRTFALEQIRVREAVAESLLDHATSDGTAQHYDVTQFYDEREEVLRSWCDLLINFSAY